LNIDTDNIVSIWIKHKDGVKAHRKTSPMYK